MKIDPELFDEWKAHPITEALMQALRAHSAHVRNVWAETAWRSGVSVPDDLLRKRERAMVLQEITEINSETIEEWLK